MLTQLSWLKIKPIIFPHWQKKVLLWGSAVCLNSLALPSQAQITQAVVQEILDGNQVYIQNTQARIKDSANFGQVVLTKDSRAGLAFNNGAAGRLGNHASVTVGQCVELKSGELVVSGPVNGCVLGFTVSVQGTLYVLQAQGASAIAQPSNRLSLEDQLNNLQKRVNMLENGIIPENNPPAQNPASPFIRNDQPTGTVKVLEGKVKVISDKQPEMSVEVLAGQKVSIRQGVLSPVTPMSPQEIGDLLKGELFSGFQVPITTSSKNQAICQNLLPNSDCPINNGQNVPSAIAPVSPSNPPERSKPEQSVVSVSCQRQVNNYLANLKTTLGNSWSPPKPPEKGTWQTLVTYNVSQDGKVQNLQVVQSSGYQPLDQAALDHVQSIEKNFSPFPGCYKREILPVDQTFKLIFY